MRPQWLVGVIIGSFLVYIAMFGLAGFGLTWASTALPTTEDFNDLGTWSVYVRNGGLDPVISPAGQVLLQAGTPPVGSALGYDDRSSISNNIPGTAIIGHASSTASFLVQLTSLGLTTGVNLGQLNLQWYGYGWWWYAQIQSNGLVIYPSGTGQAQFSFAVDTAWHTWTFIQTAGTGVSVDIYYDTVKLGTFTSVAVGGLTPNLSIDVWHAMQVHVDRITIVDGAVPPTGGGGPPQTGSLDVYCTANNQPLPSVTVYASGSSTGSGVTGGNGHTTISGLTTGTYDVYATYSGRTIHASPQPSVTNGGTTPATLDFTVASGGKCVLTVTAADEYGNTIGASVSVQSGSITVRTGTTPVTWNDLDPGTYSIYVTYQSYSPSPSNPQVKTLSTTNPTTVTATFTLGGGGGGSDPFTGFLNWLNTMLSTPMVKELMMASGGLLALVSVIMMFIPTGGSRAQAPPPTYYPPRY